MPYSGTMDTALQGDAPLLFFAVEIILPGPVNIRLLDGPGFLTINGNTFTGDDATYGTLGGGQAFDDGVGDTSPHLSLTILPPTNAAAAALASASNQGSQVSVWFGVIDRATGLVIGTPDLMFVGEIDVGVLKVGLNQRSVDLDIASVWDRFFDTDEGILLNNSWHQSVWPGELGLEYITDIQLQIPWGQDGPRPNVVSDVPVNTGPLAGAIGDVRAFGRLGQIGLF